jgi:amidohydrolase
MIAHYFTASLIRRPRTAEGIFQEVFLMLDSLKEAQAISNKLTRLREYFHSHPEQSWHETETQKKIQAYLDELGIPNQKSTKTGVIATLKGAKSSDTILGIRADIDALPITEESNPSYKSLNPGTMHACGHDTHIAILLGTAKILASHKDELPVTVRLIFQPAEEYIADSGALHMKDDPLVKECTRIIALHIQGELPYGVANLQAGPIMAASDTFDVYIKGQGGHGAHPEKAIDPIAAGVAFYNTVQTLVSREIKPLDAAVIGVTAFQSGTTSNVIPDTAHLMGTTRTFTPKVRDAFPEQLERVAAGIAAATRTEIKVDYHFGTPVMVNDENVTATGLRAAAKIFGKDHVITEEPRMGGEDFAKYLAPKAMLCLGGGFTDGHKCYPQHSPYFDIEEKALPLGVAWFLEYINEYGKEVK